jgi:type IV secretion system protein TrbE
MRSAGLEAGAHYESSYFLTFLYLPPAEGTELSEDKLVKVTVELPASVHRDLCRLR